MEQTKKDMLCEIYESGEDNEKDEEDSDEEIVEENEKDQYVADGFVIMESEDEEEEISKKKLFDSFRKPKQLTRLKKKKNDHSLLFCLKRKFRI